MFSSEYTRTTGKRLTYDIEAFRDGSYVIRLRSRIMRRGLPLPASQQGFRIWGAEASAVERATADIETLEHMNEEPPVIPARRHSRRSFTRSNFDDAG